MQAEFAGQVAIVTGGSLGIGNATARLLAERGGQVVLCGRRDESVRSAVAEMQDIGLSVEGIPRMSAKPTMSDDW
jgi:NAD(P)-dependent dehydrogenase (short-subunit alcohol dehydrogenase family)